MKIEEILIVWSVYLAGAMRPAITVVVAAHHQLGLLWLVVISILLTGPGRADVVTPLAFRQDSVAPANISTGKYFNVKKYDLQGVVAVWSFMLWSFEGVEAVSHRYLPTAECFFLSFNGCRHLQFASKIKITKK